MHFEVPKLFAGTMPLLALCYFVALLVVHIGFAAAVAQDAGRLSRERSGPIIAGPVLWSVATLVGGVYVAGLYWLINHSALSRR